MDELRALACRSRNSPGVSAKDGLIAAPHTMRLSIASRLSGLLALMLDGFAFYGMGLYGFPPYVTDLAKSLEESGQDPINGKREP